MVSNDRLHRFSTRGIKNHRQPQASRSWPAGRRSSRPVHEMPMHGDHFHGHVCVFFSRHHALRDQAHRAAICRPHTDHPRWPSSCLAPARDPRHLSYLRRRERWRRAARPPAAGAHPQLARHPHPDRSDHYRNRHRPSPLRPWLYQRLRLLFARVERVHRTGRRMRIQNLRVRALGYQRFFRIRRANAWEPFPLFPWEMQHFSEIAVRRVGFSVVLCARHQLCRDTRFPPFFRRQLELGMFARRPKLPFSCGTLYVPHLVLEVFVHRHHMVRSIDFIEFEVVWRFYFCQPKRPKVLRSRSYVGEDFFTDATVTVADMGPSLHPSISGRDRLRLDSRPYLIIDEPMARPLHAIWTHQRRYTSERFGFIRVRKW